MGYLMIKLATALAVAIAAVGVAAPASAVPDLIRVSAPSVYDSSSEKSVYVQCPAGTVVLGGGGYLIGGDGHVHLSRLGAIPGLERYAVEAYEHGYYAQSWRIWGYAICGDRPSGLEYVASPSLRDSEGYKSERAECPAGTKMLSAGAHVIWGEGQVVLDDVMPSQTLTSQLTTAYEAPGGFPGDWQVIATAVCAGVPSAELRSGTTYGSGNTQFVYADAMCPAGKRVHGVGGSIGGGLGKLIYGQLHPSSTLDHTTAYVTDLEPGNPPPGNWYARAYAICAS